MTKSHQKFPDSVSSYNDQHIQNSHPSAEDASRIPLLICIISACTTLVLIVFLYIKVEDTPAKLDRMKAEIGELKRWVNAKILEMNGIIMQTVSKTELNKINDQLNDQLHRLQSEMRMLSDRMNDYSRPRQDTYPVHRFKKYEHTIWVGTSGKLDTVPKESDRLVIDGSKIDQSCLLYTSPSPRD